MKGKLLVIIIAILFMLSSCTNMYVEDNIYVGEGTVQSVQIEGTYYFVLGDDGNNFNVLNLPHNYKKDELRLGYKLKEVPSVNKYLYGKTVEAIELKRLD